MPDAIRWVYEDTMDHPPQTPAAPFKLHYAAASPFVRKVIASSVELGLRERLRLARRPSMAESAPA